MRPTQSVDRKSNRRQWILQLVRERFAHSRDTRAAAPFPRHVFVRRRLHRPCRACVLRSVANSGAPRATACRRGGQRLAMTDGRRPPDDLIERPAHLPAEMSRNARATTPNDNSEEFPTTATTRIQSDSAMKLYRRACSARFAARAREHRRAAAEQAVSGAVRTAAIAVWPLVATLSHAARPLTSERPS